MKKERWLPLPENVAYEVSDRGRVRRTRDGYVYSYHPDGRGYLRVQIGYAMRRVHQLVMFAFVGGYPADRPQINHIDGDKRNNRLENLEFCNASHNLRHAIRLGLTQSLSGLPGEKNHRHKLTTLDVLEIRRRSSLGESRASIARSLGVLPACVSKVVLRRAWVHVP